MTTRVELAIDGPLARVTFVTENGIHIFSRETRAKLAEVLSTLESSSEARVVLFRSEGRTFIAGADIHELAKLDETTGEQVAREGQDLMRRIAELAPVTLCAIHAACAGGGCELALACDLRMAAASARIGLPEVSLGLLPGWGGTVRATRLFGGAVARRMILTGELLRAEDAMRLGIVDSITADDDFSSAVEERIATLLSRGPIAQQTAKRFIAALDHADDAEAFAEEAQIFGRCCGDSQSEEGTAAFLEKRRPEWDRPA